MIIARNIGWLRSSGKKLRLNYSCSGWFARAAFTKSSHVVTEPLVGDKAVRHSSSENQRSGRAGESACPAAFVESALPTSTKVVQKLRPCHKVDSLILGCTIIRFRPYYSKCYSPPNFIDSGAECVRDGLYFNYLKSIVAMGPLNHCFTLL